MTKANRLVDQAFPIPNPTDWVSRDAATRLLACSPSTLYDLTKRGVITKYMIDGRIPLFWRPEVQALADARAYVKGVR